MSSATEICTNEDHPGYGHHHHPSGGYFKHRHPGCPSDCNVTAYYPDRELALSVGGNHRARHEDSRMSLDAMAEEIHLNAKAHGFWPAKGRNFGEMIALMHSELSEALEAYREEPAHRHYEVSRVFEGGGIGKPEGVPVELVDTMIRILDCLHHIRQVTHGEFSIDALMREKMDYNSTRPFKHDKEF